MLLNNYAIIFITDINYLGSSKKKAKHAAAQAALNQILGVPNGQATAAGDAPINNV